MSLSRLRKFIERVRENPGTGRIETPIPLRFSRITAEQSTHLIAEYQEGVPVQVLAGKYRIHRGSASQHLRDKGIPVRQRGMPEGLVEEDIRLYEQGCSLEAIGRHMDVSANTVRKRLIEAGVKMRSSYDHLLS
ncbi:hypothetical protein BJ994_001251 [Arthrobacter pigmenti]|uniref:Uncharacterized protein n=1 Tax=Arthrobacter pigmenti TaxID=271432 RepID=A0A846RR25_9MICC|nr:helix-turn-helix domain containing protein [Arthrobacter pigmenti]NJC22175.1 hypothetical protein [Arthrobacter pigmenti]